VALKLNALGWNTPRQVRGTQDAPQPLVRKVVFDGHEFGFLFERFPDSNLILKAAPYEGRYISASTHPYHQYWRLRRQVVYDFGKELIDRMGGASAGAVVESEESFWRKVSEARADVLPGAFAHDLKATIFQLERGGVVIVSGYHMGVIAVAKAMGGRYLAPMRAWKVANASALMVRQNLITELRLREDQVDIAEGFYGIVDEQFVPGGNKGATIQVLASAVPDSVAMADDSDNEVYLAVTSPLKPTPLTDARIDELIRRYELYDYQRGGVRHLVRNTSSLLADDMGLGKTRQAICAADILFGLDGCGQILIACPASLLINWSREIVMAIGEGERIAIGRHDPEAKWVIVNYDILADVVAYAHNFKVMILDEAHLLKEPTSNRTRYAFDIASKVPYRAILTGTPILNRESEIHTLLRLSGHPIGSIPLKEFEAQFAGDPAFRTQLNERISEWMLRRTKDLVLKHLKGKQRQAMFIRLTDEQRARYEAINGDASILVLPKITMLRRELEGFKVDQIVQMVTDLNGDDKILIFCEFKETISRFKAAFEARGIDYETMSGEMSGTRRQKAVDRFQEDPLKRAFVLITGAGGVGWNLTAANYVIPASLPWNPAIAAQAEDRAYRNGQLRLVIVKIPLVENTIDMDLVQMHRDKQLIAAEIVDPEEAERLAMAEFAEGFERRAA
jgi:superfamily II DNA or RNA helicase